MRALERLAQAWGAGHVEHIEGSIQQRLAGLNAAFGADAPAAAEQVRARGMPDG